MEGGLIGPLDSRAGGNDPGGRGEAFTNEIVLVSHDPCVNASPLLVVASRYNDLASNEAESLQREAEPM